MAPHCRRPGLQLHEALAASAAACQGRTKPTSPIAPVPRKSEQSGAPGIGRITRRLLFRLNTGGWAFLVVKDTATVQGQNSDLREDPTPPAEKNHRRQGVVA